MGISEIVAAVLVVGTVAGVVFIRRRVRTPQGSERDKERTGSRGLPAWRTGALGCSLAGLAVGALAGCAAAPAPQPPAELPRVVGEPTKVGAVPQAVAIHPDGRRVYVTNWGSGTVSVIDTASNRVP